MRSYSKRIAGLLLACGAAAAHADPVALVLNGSLAPSGDTFNAFATTPSINQNGQVVFLSTNMIGAHTFGIFTGTPGSIQTVALRSTAAPAGGNYNSFGSTPVLSNSGHVLFTSFLTGGASNNGTFEGPPGSIQTVELVGGATPIGGTFLNNVLPAINASNQVAFGAAVSGGLSGGAVFTGTSGSLQAAIKIGDTAPSGETISNIGLQPLINSSGQVLSFVLLTGGSSSRALLLGTPGSFQTVVRDNITSPSGQTITNINSFDLSDSGVVFIASMIDGSNGIFTGTPGSLQTVAVTGTAAPTGGNFSALATAPTISAGGQVAFVAGLSGGSSAVGIFTGTPGSLQAVALEGDAAPDNGVFTTVIGNPMLNKYGQVAFLANTSGAGISSANDTALYAGLAGSIQKIVREGDIIDVDPGIGVDLRTVNAGGIGFLSGNTTASGGSDGKASSFNEHGQLVYRLAFTNGTSGIFMSQITDLTPVQLTEVPAPAASALGLTGLALLTPRRRRRD